MADVKLLVDSLKTPIGLLTFEVGEDGVLRRMGFAEKGGRGDATRVRARDPFGVRTAMERYFDGEVHAIDDLASRGEGTEFQREVWKALRRIPVGHTWSYGQLADAIGNPKACRAVGAANRVNPIGIVVPCHRVIGQNGTLTGYAGGLPRKKWLLAHEQRYAPAGLGPLFQSAR